MYGVDMRAIHDRRLQGIDRWSVARLYAIPQASPYGLRILEHDDVEGLVLQASLCRYKRLRAVPRAPWQMSASAWASNSRWNGRADAARRSPRR
jgi:hypothetical protein